MQGRVDKNKLLQVIEERVTPYLGQMMAQAAAEVHFQKLGISDSVLTTEQMDALLDRLAKGMAVFIGREKSAQLVAEIGRAVR